MSKRLMPSMTALQCFEAVARHLSFTRAAEELFLTQSAVSKQVAQLEDMLQHLLFRRIRRRLQLTPAGSLYLAEVNKILNQVEMSTHYILSYGGNTEVLKVATQPTFGARWLIPHLKGFGQANPNIHLDLHNVLEPFDLLQGKADVVFFFGQGTWPGAECIELFGEEVVPVCAPDLFASRPLKNVGEAAETRQKQARKRSLRAVNEHSEPVFNAVSATQVVFQQPAQGIASAEQLGEQVLLQCASRPEAWHDWFDSLGLQSNHSYHGPRFETFHMVSLINI